MKNEEIHPIRLQIEAVNNFLKKQPETDTKQLTDDSKPEELGDPLTDVKMNQQANNQGSDESNAPTVSVTPGSIKGGNGPQTGQAKATFHDKTTLAENTDEVTGDQLRGYVIKTLQEHFEQKLAEEELQEAAADELLGEPTNNEEKTDEIDEAGRSHTSGRTTHLKPKNYPEKFKR